MSAPTCGPQCDRKTGHPGLCMRRCTVRPGCTERVGHRGRCTLGTFNQIGWADEANPGRRPNPTAREPEVSS